MILANRESFPLSFNTVLAFRVNKKNHPWNLWSIMNFRGSSTFHFRNVRTCNEKKLFSETGFYFTRKNQPFLRLFSVFALNFAKMEHHILVWKAFTPNAELKQKPSFHTKAVIAFLSRYKSVGALIYFHCYSVLLPISSKEATSIKDF